MAGAGAAYARTGENANAATWYNRAIERLGALGAADLEAIERYSENPDAPLPPGLRDAIARAQPMLGYVRRGARQELCDFHLDYSQGFDLLLPHLGPLRRIARVAQADALLRLHDGDAAGAAATVASMYALVDHLGGDGTMISSLVARAIFLQADETAGRGFDRAAFGGEEAGAMLRAIEGMPEDDPFDFLGAVAMEQGITVDWMASRFGREEQRANAAEEIGWVGEDHALTDRLAGMTDEDFAASIEQYDRMMDRVVETFALDDPDAARSALAQISRELETGEHGLVAMLMSPAFARILELRESASEVFRARLGMLEGVARGAVRPEDEANAAWYYARAIEAMRKVEAARLDVLALVAEGRSDADAAAAGEILRDVQPAIEFAREGAGKRRCDFSFLPSDEKLPPLCPGYVAGMHDLLRVLHADARRRLASGDVDGAVDRLAAAWGVVAHLSGDEPIMSALVARCAFVRGQAIIAEAIASDRLSLDHRAALLAAARRTPRTDPFGFIGSVVAGREALLRFARAAAAGARPNDDAAQRTAEVRSAVQEANGDQLMYVFAIYDTLERAGRSDRKDTGADADADTGADADTDAHTDADTDAHTDAHTDANTDADTDAHTPAPTAAPAPAPAQRPPPPDPLTRVADLISADALRATRAEAPRAAPLLARGEVDVFAGRTVPSIADVVASMWKARAELRKALTMLGEEEPAAGGAGSGEPAARDEQR